MRSQSAVRPQPSEMGSGISGSILVAIWALTSCLISDSTAFLLPPQHVLPFESDHGGSCSARLGMVVLSVDETVEGEFRKYLNGFHDVGFYTARQFKGPAIDVKSLEAQKREIRNASALLPRFPFDSVGFACTSDAAVLGPAVVGGLVSEGAMVAATSVTNPLTAAIEALHALNVSRVALLTPYTMDVTEILAKQFENHSLTTTTIATFNQSEDSVVARITPDSVLHSIEQLKALDGGQAQAIFVSCTQTRTVDVIAEAEASIGLPVVSSNSALAWHMLKLSGLLVPEKQRELAAFGGKLFQAPVEHQGPRHPCP